MKEVIKERDRTVLAEMMVLFFHAGERCLSILEDEIKRSMDNSKRYKEIVRSHGKAVADEVLRKEIGQILRHNDKYKCGQIIKTATQLHTMMEEITNFGISNYKTPDTIEKEKEMTDEELTEYNAKRFDKICKDHEDLTNSTEWICRIVSQVFNCCETEDSKIKLESTIKILAKGNRVPQDIIDKFKRQ